MSRIPGTNIQVLSDTMANSTTIRLDGEPAATTQEVILYLGSQQLARRTRDKLLDTKVFTQGSVVEVVMKFRDAWDYIVELDIISSLRELFAQKGAQYVIA